ncbi:50S ribosomal protein L22 [bacterium]|nr:50S ribosomal protein L22 [bacterium]
MEAKAVARWVRVSPRKMRLVVDMVRGQNVRSAVNQLHFSTKRAAEPVEKTIRSALSNLMTMDEATKLDPTDVFIKEIRVDEGPTLRRWRARAMGRATRIRKRTSHLTVVVAARQVSEDTNK